MADENADVSTEPVGATTPASEPSVESKAPVNPSIEADPWADFGVEKVEEPKVEEPKTEEPKTEKPAVEEPKAPEIEKPKTEEPKTEEKSLEDQVLEEAFSDEETAPAGDAKPAEKEDLDSLDPKEQIERQRNATAKAWAERQSKKAEIVKDFQYADKVTGEYKPIEAVAAKFEELNPERYAELSQTAAHKLVDANPEAAFQRAYVVAMLQKNPLWDYREVALPTLEQFLNSQYSTTAAPATAQVAAAVPGEIASLTKELDEQLGFDWRNPANDGEFYDDRELAFAKALRITERQALDAAAKLEGSSAELQKLQSAPDEAALRREQSEVEKTVNDYRASIEEKILPYIAKNTGLEPRSDDSPKMAAFKANKLSLFTGTEYQRANGFPSAFEAYAYNESTVKGDLDVVTTRIVEAQVRETQARLKGDKAAEARFRALSADEKVPMFTLLAQASKEFKTKFITPDLELIGDLSSNLTNKITEAAERVEVVNGASSTSSRQKPKEYATADDVWQGMVDESAREEALARSG